MSNVYTKHAASLASLETYLADGLPSFRWNSADYPCMVSGLTKGKDLGLGGFGTNKLLRLVVRNALFSGGLPAEKQTIAYKATATSTAVSLRIQSIIQSSATQFLMTCIDTTDGV